MRTGLAAVMALALFAATPARTMGAPQVRVSPGPLSAAHAKLDDLANCGRCHDPARGLAAERCLACHKPIADRIVRRKGVHRGVTDDCRRCHTEHRGVDGDLRRLDRQTFDHAAETGFVLDGQHARSGVTCTSCHKSRSFVDVRSDCGSCHADAHKGTLGRTCTPCHRTTVPFKQTRNDFDHAGARFVLTGAHLVAACEKCHAGGVFRGLKFEDCSGCHKVSHRRSLGPTCGSCHVTERWATAARGFEHAKAGFALAGAHARMACAKCHVAGVRTPLAHDRCAACHADAHRTSVREDCHKCHDEESFRKASFDHGARTGFALAGRHEGLPCRKCHTGLSAPDVPLALKVLDFRGATGRCASCHRDQHKGEFGLVCNACHGPATFKAAGFVHPRSPGFFAGRHQGLACVRCHVRASDPRGARIEPVSGRGQALPPSMACSGCHVDVHFGQVEAPCERCHAVDAAKFAPTRFSHDGGSFRLAGRHASIACAKCHPLQTAVFPAGAGTAMRLRPVARDCRSCHQDPHMGQADPDCARCHTLTSFTLAAYDHSGLDDLFGVATHAHLPCRACHKVETGRFPAGWGTAMRLKVGRTCLECHP
ncbi:MAG TPA: hypothetical protein VGK32_04825 [Vicinamibacterales bacterium]|jgi:hypothetical protein